MKIIENPVISEWGYVHPEYFDFKGREWVLESEWQEWLQKENIEDYLGRLENEDSKFNEIYFEGGDGDLSQWSPEKPDGEGWFIGAVFDTEDGPICVWLRNKE